MQVTTKQRVGIKPVTPLPFLSCCSSTWLSLLAPKTLLEAPFLGSPSLVCCGEAGSCAYGNARVSWAAG